MSAHLQPQAPQQHLSEGSRTKLIHFALFRHAGLMLFLFDRSRKNRPIARSPLQIRIYNKCRTRTPPVSDDEEDLRAYLDRKRVRSVPHREADRTSMAATKRRHPRRHRGQSPSAPRRRANKPQPARPANKSRARSSRDRPACGQSPPSRGPPPTSPRRNSRREHSSGSGRRQRPLHPRQVRSCNKVHVRPGVRGFENGCSKVPALRVPQAHRPGSVYFYRSVVILVCLRDQTGTLHSC